MLSDLRNNATTALEKAKLAISNRSLSGNSNSTTSNHEGQQVVLDCDDDEEDQRQQLQNQNTAANNSLRPGTIEPLSVLRSSLTELRAGSTRALEKAKLVVSGGVGRNSSSIQDDNSNKPDQSRQQLNGNSNEVDDDQSLSSSQQSSQVDRLEELSQYCPKLTIQQRLMGFFICFSVGCEYSVFLGMQYAFEWKGNDRWILHMYRNIFRNTSGLQFY
jgi:hypothetical protein